MWEVRRRDGGDVVATVHFDPYKVRMQKPVNGLKQVLQEAGQTEQLNRNGAPDVDVPRDLKLDPNRDSGSGYEGWDDPSERYVVGQIADVIRDGFVIGRADGVSGADQSDVDDTYQQFTDTVNMTASEVRDWGDHDCSDRASQNPQEVRDRVVRLLETDKSDWGDSEVTDANRVISFVSRMRGVEQSEGTEDCPSDRDISLMNWGYRPDGVSL